MTSDTVAPRIKLSGKRLVGFDTSARLPAGESADVADRGTVSKIGAVKLGSPKPGLRRPGR
jgi:hypothetical protein